MTPIYHLTEPDTWKAAVAAGEYRQSTRGVSLERQGFIHCSLLHQVRRVGGFVYADADELVLLEIDPDKLTSKVVFEPGEPGVLPDAPASAGAGPAASEAPPSLVAPLLSPDDAGPRAEEFPHIYGPVPVDAVVAVHRVTRDGTGRMVLPE